MRSRFQSERKCRKFSLFHAAPAPLDAAANIGTETGKSLARSLPERLVKLLFRRLLSWRRSLHDLMCEKRGKIKRNQVKRKMFLRGPRLFWAYLINNDYSSAVRISHARLYRVGSVNISTILFRFSSISSNSLRGQASCSDLSADFSLRTGIWFEGTRWFKLCRTWTFFEAICWFGFNSFEFWMPCDSSGMLSTFNPSRLKTIDKQSSAWIRLRRCREDCNFNRILNLSQVERI